MWIITKNINKKTKRERTHLMCQEVKVQLQKEEHSLFQFKRRKDVKSVQY